MESECDPEPTANCLLLNLWSDSNEKEVIIKSKPTSLIMDKSLGYQDTIAHVIFQVTQGREKWHNLN